MEENVAQAATFKRSKLMNGVVRPHQKNSGAAPPTWLQNAAIFGCCTNFFSTALANLGFVSFLLLFAWVGLTHRRRVLNFSHFPTAVAIAMLLYIGWQIIGLTYSDAQTSYALKNVFSERKILYVLPLTMVFYEDAPKQRFLFWFLLTASVGLVVSFALRSHWVDAALRFDPASVFRSPPTQGMLFAVSAFLSAWMAGKKTNTWRSFGLYALALAFTVNIVFITSGRSGYIVFLVLLVWCFWLRFGFKGLFGGVVVAVVLSGTAFVGSDSVHSKVMMAVNEAQTYSTAPAETSIGRRMVMLETTLGMVRDHPLIGIGTGAYKKHFSEIAEKKYTGWRAEPFDDPHNQYLFVWTENGLIGLATFLYMLFILFRQCVAGGVYGTLAAGCLLAWAATSFFSGHFRTFPEGHLIAFIVGILMVNRNSADKSLHATI